MTDDRAHLRKQIDEVFESKPSGPNMRTVVWVSVGFLGLMLLRSELLGFQSERPLYSQTGKEICFKPPLFGIEKCRMEGHGEKHDNY